MSNRVAENGRPNTVYANDCGYIWGFIHREIIEAQREHGDIPELMRAMVILGGEYGEALREALSMTNPTTGPVTASFHRDNLIDELTQVASVAILIIHDLRGRNGTEPPCE